MERSVAIRKLMKLLGKTMSWRIDEKAPSAEERENARLEIPYAVKRRNEARSQLDARRDAVLKFDIEYQSLKELARRHSERVDQLQSIGHHYKITVGKTVGNLFFSVIAQGDSWEEIINKVTKEKAGV